MIKKLKGKAKGFTIIEVLIVLAIAGLILTIVFIAVPQLQRNTRDSKRQSIASRLSTELQNFASNNQGTFPFAAATNANPGFDCKNGTAASLNCRGWYNRYINGTPPVDIIDPSTGTQVEIFNTTLAPTPPATYTWAVGRVIIGAGLRCNGEGTQTASGAGVNAKDFAIVIGLERSNTWFCVGNT